MKRTISTRFGVTSTETSERTCWDCITRMSTAERCGLTAERLFGRWYGFSSNWTSQALSDFDFLFNKVYGGVDSGGPSTAAPTRAGKCPKSSGEAEPHQCRRSRQREEEWQSPERRSLSARRAAEPLENVQSPVRGRAAATH